MVNLSGNFYDHWQGVPAVYVSKWKLGTAPTLGQHRFALAGTTASYFTMYGADNGSFGNPIAANVRSGIVYGGGNLTGTCAVPAASSVAFGVPVDATTGTAVLTPEAVWGAASRTLTSASGPTAADNATAVWAAASRTITGGTVDTLTNAPTSVTPAQIRAELDANSTQLAAIKAKTDALNTTRLGQVATTEIVGNLLAQANS